MKATIDVSGCIACGLCVDTCPSVFKMGDDNLAEVYIDEIPKGDEALAIEAQDGCPVSVITVS